uniref:Sec-independent protein translocase component TatC n=1 Tax=Wrangelia sp. TaxID=2575620 RepID=A0A4D6WZ34_9FLOR|nr:Sec-independent protein translocase component TatC [Wrangelia sp.]
MKKIWKASNEKTMPIIEHLIELRSRILISLIIFFIITVVCLINIKYITYILQEPAKGIKFLQLAPGEYFFVSIKMSISLGILLSSPFSIYQIILFILPGLTIVEASYIIPILLGSISLFFIGIIFSYNILTPAALNFLINYGSEIVEPIWSFEEYYNFIILILFSTGIVFQIPVVQFILGISKIYSSKKMLEKWKYVIFTATIMSAIITPSTDPITQTCLTLAIIILYLITIFILKFLNK